MAIISSTNLSLKSWSDIHSYANLNRSSHSKINSIFKYRSQFYHFDPLFMKSAESEEVQLLLLIKLFHVELANRGPILLPTPPRAEDRHLPRNVSG